MLGFIGTPWTLAAYAIEGAADRWGLASRTPHTKYALAQTTTEDAVQWPHASGLCRKRLAPDGVLSNMRSVVLRQMRAAARDIVIHCAGTASRRRGS